MKIKRNIPRPNSSFFSKKHNENLIPLDSNSYINTTIEKPRQLILSKSKQNLFKPPLPSSMETISKITLFKKSNSTSKLDLLNLVIETNPDKYNLTKIEKKIKEINPIFIQKISFVNPEPKYSENTKKMLYKYNILYGSNSNNIIRTYSTKMRPNSTSIFSFINNLSQTEEDKSECLLSNNDIEKLIKAKCKDLNLNLNEDMIFRFKNYCLNKCKNRKMDLSGCYLGYYSSFVVAEILYSNTQIAILNLGNNNLGDDGIKIISNAIKDNRVLVSFNISSNSISHKGGKILFNNICCQKSIINLDISNSRGMNRNRLTSVGIQNIGKVLTENLYLEMLNLGGNSIKNEGLKYICNGLENNKTLLHLNITNNDIDKYGIEKYVLNIHSSKLISLDISSNNIMDEGIINLTDSLKNFPNIHNLNISNCGIEFKGFHYLLMNLQNMKRIENLNVSKNKISSEKFELLKPFFIIFGVKHLDISNCLLGDKSGGVLGECLQLNESITKINISENKIGDNGFKFYIHLFKNNYYIKYFDASKNFISEITARDFIKNLKNNHTLKSLNLFDNQIKNDIGNVILEMLTYNKTLLNINVNFNRIQLKNIEDINKRLKLNNDEMKKKFMPNLIKEISDIKINTENFQYITKKINDETVLSNYLNKRVNEDTENFNKLRKEEEEELKRLQNENKALEEEINIINLKLKNVMETKKYLSEQFIKEKKILSNNIEKLKDDKINIIKTINSFYQRREKITNELKNTILQKEKKVKTTKEKILTLLKSLNSINEDIIQRKESLIYSGRTISEESFNDFLHEPNSNNSKEYKDFLSQSISPEAKENEKSNKKKKGKKNKKIKMAIPFRNKSIVSLSPKIRFSHHSLHKMNSISYNNHPISQKSISNFKDL